MKKKKKKEENEKPEIPDTLSGHQQDQLSNLINKYNNVFQKKDKILGGGD